MRARLIGSIVVGGLALIVFAAPVAAKPRNPIVDRPVRFLVQNTNTSVVPCMTDGAEYVVKGHLVAPRSALRRPDPAVTLYVHGLAFGEFFYRLPGVPGYDLAKQMARRGHASITIDRLGYGASPHPNGFFICVGGQADITHQLIGQLRAGSYTVRRRAATAFDRVALAGHSSGGLISEIAAYSYPEPEALIVTGFADRGASPKLISEIAASGLLCAAGGEPAGPGESGGYAYIGQSPEEFQQLMFHDAEPAVLAAATALRTREPCNGTLSSPQGTTIGTAALATIETPVLLVCGEEDVLFPPPACDNHRRLFSGSDDVTAEVIPNAGSALTLERAAPVFRGTLERWLSERGF